MVGIVTVRGVFPMATFWKKFEGGAIGEHVGLM